MECHLCGKETKPTKAGKYRKHTRPFHDPISGDCDASGTRVPVEEAEPATIPGAAEYVEEVSVLAREQYEAYREKVNSRFSQPDPDPAPVVRSSGQASLFSQPGKPFERSPATPMTDLGKELTARLKELFYSYDNRRSEDNRAAQTTLGPSEIGTPCDRRLALSLMRMPPVNPGGDGWAAFVGTCIHAGLAEMFMWADAGTGRFAVEQRLEFPSEIVPKGTADLIDRVLLMVDDHKCQGRWSRNKLKSSGPTQTYRVQAHVYAYGAKKRGENIEHIAIISWPRDEATLDDLYVFTEPYDPAIAVDAFKRVERIATEAAAREREYGDRYSDNPSITDLETRAMAGGDFDVADDCRYCPFHLPNARDITKGCNGKR